MNENVLYEMAYTICKTIEEKQRLEAENERLKLKLDEIYRNLQHSNKEDEKFLGELLTGMLTVK